MTGKHCRAGRRSSRAATVVTAGLAGAAACAGLTGVATANAGTGSAPVIVANGTDSPVPVTGTVRVGNLPATQPVSGTVNVANLPTTQPVSGTVNVANLPATQPVSGTVLVHDAAIQHFYLEAHDEVGDSYISGDANLPSTPLSIDTVNLEYTARSSEATPRVARIDCAGTYLNLPHATVPLELQPGGEVYVGNLSDLGMSCPAGSRITVAVLLNQRQTTAYAAFFYAHVYAHELR